jgi:metal-responsive CopG/Arc/MetJ family transcriptional regulator
MKRSAKRRRGKLLSVWVSATLVSRIDEGAKKEDSDRSKFVRNAIREKLSQPGGETKK